MSTNFAQRLAAILFACAGTLGCFEKAQQVSQLDADQTDAADAQGVADESKSDPLGEADVSCALPLQLPQPPKNTPNPPCAEISLSNQPPNWTGTLPAHRLSDDSFLLLDGTQPGQAWVFPPELGTNGLWHVSARGKFLQQLAPAGWPLIAQDRSLGIVFSDETCNGRRLRRWNGAGDLLSDVMLEKLSATGKRQLEFVIGDNWKPAKSRRRKIGARARASLCAVPAQQGQVSRRRACPPRSGDSAAPFQFPSVGLVFMRGFFPTIYK